MIVKGQLVYHTVNLLLLLFKKNNQFHHQQKKACFVSNRKTHTINIRINIKIVFNF